MVAIIVRPHWAIGNGLAHQKRKLLPSRPLSPAHPAQLRQGP
jgi:hypothetical protein